MHQADASSGQIDVFAPSDVISRLSIIIIIIIINHY